MDRIKKEYQLIGQVSIVRHCTILLLAIIHGIQGWRYSFFNKRLNFRPTIELTGDIYPGDDKVLTLNPDETPIDYFRKMISLFVEVLFQPSKYIYLSFTAGPGFITGRF